jgi:hypothetical protein
VNEYNAELHVMRQQASMGGANGSQQQPTAAAPQQQPGTAGQGSPNGAQQAPGGEGQEPSQLLRLRTGTHGRLGTPPSPRSVASANGVAPVAMPHPAAVQQAPSAPPSLAAGSRAGSKAPSAIDPAEGAPSLFDAAAAGGFDALAYGFFADMGGAADALLGELEVGGGLEDALGSCLEAGAGLGLALEGELEPLGGLEGELEPLGGPAAAGEASSQGAAADGAAVPQGSQGAAAGGPAGPLQFTSAEMAWLQAAASANKALWEGTNAEDDGQEGGNDDLAARLANLDLGSGFF